MVTDRYRPDADGDHKREPDRRRQSLRTALTRTRLWGNEWPVPAADAAAAG